MSSTSVFSIFELALATLAFAIHPVTILVTAHQRLISSWQVRPLIPTDDPLLQIMSKFASSLRILSPMQEVRQQAAAAYLRGCESMHQSNCTISNSCDICMEASHSQRSSEENNPQNYNEVYLRSHSRALLHFLMFCIAEAC